MPVDPAAKQIAANVAVIRDRMAEAAARAGREPASVRLVAAAKTKSAAMVDAVIAAGVADIGENYVQEAVAKRAVVQGVARWHLIGHLQRNKAARAADSFDFVQTVDSIALGEALDRHAAAHGRIVAALIEVNVGGEHSKRGVAPAAVPDLLAGLQPLSHVRVDGLMTIPPVGSPSATRPFFARLRALAEHHGLREVSMGMSDDFEVAIEEGATIIRVGRAIFGVRATAGGRG